MNYLRGFVSLVILGSIPAIYGTGVCQNDLMSGVPDNQITASSVFGSTDPKTDYGAPRGRLNTTEVKDASGVTHTGSWTANKLDVNQWIQVELKDPSLIRGLVTQGRDGCCKQWVTKYKVQYSDDCKTWKTVGGPTPADQVQKGNSDENTPVTNMFKCPIIAKCIRVNPLEWNSHISMRLDLLGCPLTGGAPTAQPSGPPSTTAAVSATSPSASSTTGAASTTPAAASTTPAAASTTPAAASTTSAAASRTPAAASTTTAAASTTTAAASTTTSAAATTPSAAATSTSAAASTTSAQTSSNAATRPSPGLNTAKGKCISTAADCKGKPNGDYQSCTKCGGYVTCVWDNKYDRPCPVGLKFDAKKQMCDWSSTTCSGP